jgi:hypothetical protein
MVRRQNILLGCLILGSAVLGGCGGPDKDAICKDVEACRKGNDRDVSACTVQLDYADEASSDLGCSSEYDNFYQCLQDHATCENGNWGLHGSNAKACDAEQHAFNHCTGGADTAPQSGPG